MSEKRGQPVMSTLTIRIPEDHKENFDDAAYRLGFTRMKDGEMKGDITALLNLLARALPSKSEAEIKAFLFGTSPRE